MMPAVFALLLTGLLVGQTAAPTGRRQLLDVASKTPTTAVRSGERFTIALTLTPEPGLHVYSPEVAGGYKPIAVTIQPQPGLVVRGISFPPSEKYYFAPLKETVPVYQKPFTVIQELLLDPSAAGQAARKGQTSITIKGTLNFQACDEKLCFPPRTVPMTWTIPIKESA